MRFTPVRLRVSTAWSVFGNAVYGLGQWAMVVLLARIGSRELVGNFALALAITAPIDLFARLQLRTVQATDAARTHPFGSYLALRLALSAGSVALSAAVALALRYPPTIVLVTAILAVAKSFEALSDVAYGQMQLHDRLDLIAGSLTLKSVLSVVFLFLGVRYFGGLVPGAIGLVVAWAIGFLAYDATVTRRMLRAEGRSHEFAARWDRTAMRRLILLTWPLGVVTTLGSLRVNLPRLLVGNRLGVAEVGALAAMAYLVVVGSRFVSSVSAALAAPLGRAFLAHSRAAVKRVAGTAFAVAVGAGLAGVAVALVAGRPLVSLVYGREYTPYVPLLVVLMVAATFDFASSVLQLVLTSLQVMKEQAVMRSIGVCTTVIACLAMLGPYGVFGAGAGLAIGSAVEFAIAGVLAMRALARWARGA